MKVYAVVKITGTANMAMKNILCLLRFFTLNPKQYHMRKNLKQTIPIISI